MLLVGLQESDLAQVKLISFGAPGINDIVGDFDMSSDGMELYIASTACETTPTHKCFRGYISKIDMSTNAISWQRKAETTDTSHVYSFAATSTILS